MRLALHLVWGCYGFWLPNDPRGSWSLYVGNRTLFEIGGRATKVQTTRSVAKASHDRAHRRAAKSALRDPPVRLSGLQARDVALSIAEAASADDLTLHALCVMPDHVHLVVLNGGEDARRTIGRFKAAATRRLHEQGRPPRGDRTPWVRGGWFVSLDSPLAIARAIAYVENNPAEAGLRRQRWSGVTPFVGR